MASDYKALRTACHMPPCVRRTKCRSEHTVHKIGGSVGYIESENIEPVCISKYLNDAKTRVENGLKFPRLSKDGLCRRGVVSKFSRTSQGAKQSPQSVPS